MNEWLCNSCGETIKSDDEPKACPFCGGDDIQQNCPMCGTIINPDNKVCPECKEAVA